MPPRRSTRSASVQPAPPPPDPKPPSSKRKRGQTAEIVEVVIEQENVKPPSRSRRSTSAAPATKRATSSRKKNLEEVPEGDEEEEELEDLPPVKKPRPSVGSADEQEEEEEEELPKSKGTKGRKAPAKGGSSGRVSSRRSSVKKVDSDNEEYEEVKPAKPAPRNRTSRTSSTSKAKAPTATSRGVGRSIRTLQSKQKDEAEHEDPDPDEIIEDSEEELLGSQRPPSKRVQVKVERPDPPVSSNRAHSGRTSSSRASQEPGSSATSRSRTISEKDIEGHPKVDEELEPPPSRQPAKAVTPSSEVEEDTGDTEPAVQGTSTDNVRPAIAEETSLLDSVQNAPPEVQPAEMEESQGPQPRLVIHKMALVNFKSYAGRQDIGPFHKASHSEPFQRPFCDVVTFSPFPPSLVLMGRANQIQSTPCYSFLVIERLRCDKENFLSSSITLLGIRTWKSAA